MTAAAASVFVRDTPVFVESTTGRLAKYPTTAWARWALRAGIALPTIVLAIVFDRAVGGDWSGTANGDLVARLATVPWGSTSIEVLGELYPLVSSTTAVLIPGGALGLAVAGAVVGAFLVQLVAQSMHRKRFSLPVCTVFAVTLAATPVYAYIVTTNFQATLGLAFLGLGMLDVVRFVTYANTQAGFRAGLLFAASAFADSTGLFAALAAATVGTFIVRSRAGSRAANAIVVLFPTLSLLGALALVGIAFRLGPLFVLGRDIAWDQGRFDFVMAYLAGPPGWLYLAPTALVILTAFLLGRPGVGLSGIVVTVSTLLAYIVNLTPPGVAGNTYVLILLMCVAVVPAARTRLEAAVTCVISILLFAIGWLNALTTPTLVAWTQTLFLGSPQ